MCDELVRTAQDADLHLQCCYMAASRLDSAHMKTVSQYTLACSDTAGKIAERAGVKFLVLTHFKHPTEEELEEIEADVRRDYGGVVALSKDLDEYVF
ncbi:ribonuclease Z [compost metagenome]